MRPSFGVVTITHFLLEARTASLWVLAAAAVGCGDSAAPLQSPDAGGTSESGANGGWADGSGEDSGGGRTTDGSAADGSAADGSATDGSATDAAATDGSADAALTDNSCAAMTRQLDCLGCCEQVHASGILAYLGYLRDCVCATGSPCQTACAMDICLGPPEPPPGGLPAGGCATCIGSGSLQCGNAIAMACLANAECKAFSTCTHGCLSAVDAGGKD
jgi:hypothetical protein